MLDRGRRTEEHPDHLSGRCRPPETCGAAAAADGGSIRHLPAEMPAAPTTARGQMDVRIARKVAALTGIAGPPGGSDDAGRGHLWFSDYRALTTTELSLGGPVVASPPPDAGRGVVDAGLFRRNRSTFRMADDTQATGTRRFRV